MGDKHMSMFEEVNKDKSYSIGMRTGLYFREFTFLGNLHVRAI